MPLRRSTRAPAAAAIVGYRHAPQTPFFAPISTSVSSFHRVPVPYRTLQGNKFVYDPKRKEWVDGSVSASNSPNNSSASTRVGTSATDSTTEGPNELDLLEQHAITLAIQVSNGFIWLGRGRLGEIAKTLLSS